MNPLSPAVWDTSCISPSVISLTKLMLKAHKHVISNKKNLFPGILVHCILHKVCCKWWNVCRELVCASRSLLMGQMRPDRNHQWLYLCAILKHHVTRGWRRDRCLNIVSQCKYLDYSVLKIEIDVYLDMKSNYESSVLEEKINRLLTANSMRALTEIQLVN